MEKSWKTHDVRMEYQPEPHGKNTKKTQPRPGDFEKAEAEEKRKEETPESAEAPLEQNEDAV